MRNVIKIGGGILREESDFERIAEILGKRKKRETVLVVSAIYGVTDLLIEFSKLPSRDTREKTLSEIVRRHEEVIGKNDLLTKKISELSKAMQNLEEKENKESYDLLLSYGERLSALVMQEFLNSKQIPAKAIEADELIVTDGEYNNASCVIEKTREKCGKVIEEMKQCIPVITGFFGKSVGGKVTVFSRGGTDYTAGIIASCIDAERLEIWKDVDGFMTADPKVVGNAKKLDVLSFNETEELCNFGAKILHPRTLEYLRNKSCTVVIKNVLNPEEDGTIIQKEGSGREISSVAAKKKISVISARGAISSSIGVAGQLFTVMSRKNVVVDAISTSQVSISFTIDSVDFDNAMLALRENEVKGIEKVAFKKGMALIGVVGDGIAESDTMIGGRVLNAFYKAGIKAEMISLGVSEISLNFVISEEKADEAVRIVHEEFNLANGDGK